MDGAGSSPLRVGSSPASLDIRSREASSGNSEAISRRCRRKRALWLGVTVLLTRRGVGIFIIPHLGSGTSKAVTGNTVAESTISYTAIIYRPVLAYPHATGKPVERLHPFRAGWQTVFKIRLGDAMLGDMCGEFVSPNEVEKWHAQVLDGKAMGGITMPTFGWSKIRRRGLTRLDRGA